MYIIKNEFGRTMNWGTYDTEEEAFQSLLDHVIDDAFILDFHVEEEDHTPWTSLICH